MKRTALSIACLLALAGCGGGSKENPKEALTGAFEAMAEAEGFTTTIRLDSTVEDLRAGDGSMSEEVAQMILDSSFVMSATNAEKPEDASAEIMLNIGDLDAAFEMKVVGFDFYMRADVKGLLELFDQDPAQADAFAQQGEQMGLDFARPAVEGEWLAFRNLDETVKRFTGQSIGQASQAQRKALEKLGERLEADAEITRGDAEGPGDHLRASLGLRELYKAFLEMIEVSGTGPLPGMPPASEVPTDPIVFDTWVEDDFVRRISFDILQIAKIMDEEPPKGMDRLAVTIDLEEFTDEVEAPDGAVDVDLEKLMSAFGGFGGMGGPGGPPPGPGADFCDQLKGAPPEVVKEFAKECPQLQS